MGQDFGTMLVGAIIMGGTTFDPVPLDEVVGIPLGLKLIADGAEGKSIGESIEF